MAQEITTSSPVENTPVDAGYAQILQRLQEIERKAAQDAVVIQKLQEEQAKRKTEKEKEEKQKQDQKNVVKKLPTVLTTNERKRYSEIGKRFLLGAEEQFRQIQKGIKTKQMMKTSKDYFLKGFEKIKAQKQKTKKKSFWKILFGSLVIIGAAAFLFRDKIAKMMPDLSEKTGGIFTTIKIYIGNMIKGCWQYITKSLGGSISSIFHRIFTDSIPSILQFFFFETLPSAIFNTYLAIMSQFDPRANAMMSSGSHDPQTRADIVSATAEDGELDMASPVNRQIDAAMGIVQGVVGVFGKIQRNERVTQEEIALMQKTLGRWMLLQNRQGEVWLQTKAIFQGAEHLLGTWTGNQFEGGELYRMIRDGEFDWQSFLYQFLSSDRTAQAMSLILKNMFSGKNEEQRKRLSEKYGIKFTDNGELDTKSLVGTEGDVVRRKVHNASMIGTDTEFSKAAEYYASMRGRLGAQWSGIARDENKIVAVTDVGNQDKLGYMYDGMGYISLQLIRDATVKEIHDFAKAINTFVTDGGIVGDFKYKIKSMVESMSKYFNEFFIGSLDILKNILYGILTYSGHNTTNDTPQKNVQNNAIVNNSGVLVNVDMTGNQAISIATAFSNIVTTQKEVLKSIDNSISSLEKVNESLSSIGRMHALSKSAFIKLLGEVEGNKKSSEEKDTEILGQVAKNKKAIQDLQKTTKSPFAWLAPPLQSQADRENGNTGR